jgi:cytosine deaminase
MLVLSRHRGQAIMIGHDTEITVIDIRGDKVRVGIRAPRTTSVHRKEVFDAIQIENQSAAGLQPGDLPGSASVASAQPLAGMESHMVVSNHTGETQKFMKAAIAEARKGLAEGGLPIGSVLVRNGEIIAAGHNRRVQHSDPMAHAEIDCLTKAGRQKTYKDTVLYSTLMPCYLCSGAVVQFGIPKVIVGESANFPGGPEFMRQHGVDVVDLHDAECIEMMSAFIRAHPELWHEDIGK